MVNVMELNYNNMESEYDKNKKSIEAQIKFLKSIGALKDVKELTPQFKEKMAEDLKRFWKDTPMDMIAQIS